MRTYQKQLYKTFSQYQVPPSYPTYPPQHIGPYMEEYYVNNFLMEQGKFKRYLIPIYWTSSYIHKNIGGLQQKLSSLDPGEKYFAVCTHDDAPNEVLPPDTVVFSGGGNKGDIPIPLICSGYTDIKKQTTRDIFCSFVGSLTHPIRQEMFQSLKDKKEYILSMDQWSDTIIESKAETFRNIMERSQFTLCPRGYGVTSYRLYEALQLGSVPVFIYDKPWFPWETDLNWDDFCVLIRRDEIQFIDSILKSYSPSTINKMSRAGQKVYEDHFSLKSTYRIITEKVRG
jgi:hypothetical protein